MKTALIYDDTAPQGKDSWVEAEYENPRTIQALLEVLEEHCDKAVPIALGPRLIDKIRKERPDLVFNIAEGRGGPNRESIVPVILEYLNIPYTGSDGITLGISLNKALTKRIAAQAGIRTPSFQLFRSGADVAKHLGELEFPVLLKPNFGGSGVGITSESVLYDVDRLSTLVSERVARYNQPCLVENYINGTDVTVGLLGNLPVEVLPPGKTVTYEGKRKVICPFPLSRSLQEQLTNWSLEIYGLIGAVDFSRLDYIVDKRNRAHFLEINPLPGLSPYYGIMPVLAAAAGYSLSDLIGAIMKKALIRRQTTGAKL